jgi:hypothetical protein
VQRGLSILETHTKPDSSDSKPSFGYDSAALKEMEWQVDSQIQRRRLRWIMEVIFRFFGLSF